MSNPTTQFKAGNRGGPGRPRGSGGTRFRGWSDSYGFDFLTQVAEGKPVVERSGNTDRRRKKTILVPASLELRIAVTIYIVNRGYGKPTSKTKLEVADQEKFEAELKEAEKRLAIGLARDNARLGKGHSAD